MGSLVVAVLLIVLLVALFYGKKEDLGAEEKEKAVIARLRARYQDALQAGDKEKATEYGRDYYRYLRNKRELSAFDEQVIRKDIGDL